MTIARFRFAPSPNGSLHLGHAYSALLNERLASAGAGHFLLRIEDIDITRCTPEKTQGVIDDLAWLGLAFAPDQIRFQSQHFDSYRAALERLQEMGLVYPAFMSRGDIRAHVDAVETSGKSWPRDPDGAPLYPGTERSLEKAAQADLIASGRPFAWRLDMSAAIARLAGDLSWQEASDENLTRFTTVHADTALWGDVIVARRDIPVSYHLAVVMDDALQGITHIVRGKDLYAATAVHRLLQYLLGLAEPLYLHHRLIGDDDGQKLSKSKSATALVDYRQQGKTPQDIATMLGF